MSKNARKLAGVTAGAVVPGRSGPGLTATLLLLLLAACGGGPTSPTAEPPVITITGVADGGEYAGPVTIQVSADRGSLSATLNGAPFFSGGTVSQPGSYTLVVNAQHQGQLSSRTVHFVILPPAGISGTLIIRLFDLGPTLGGGGDAILITDSTASGMAHVLFDAGPAGPDGSQPGFVAQRLTQLGIDTLQILLLTHAHADHFLGMPPVLNDLVVRRFYYNGEVRNLTSYNNVLSVASARAESVTIVTDTLHDALGWGGTRLITLPPWPDSLAHPSPSGTALNDASLGVRLDRGTFSMFFTGDGEVRANNRWRTLFPSLSGNVRALKVGHHGANNAIFDDGTGGTSFTSTWLQHTAPQLAVISANGVSHPRVRALSRLHQQPELEVYCTNVHGEITIRVNPNGEWTVSVQRNAASNCVPGSEATT
jgi:competence protein ComEC